MICAKKTYSLGYGFGDLFCILAGRAQGDPDSTGTNGAR
jgi:hypothetical protein